MRVLLDHWSVDPVTPVIAVLAVVYLVGERRRLRAVRRAGRAVSHSRELAFAAGLAALVIAIDSPLDYWSDQYLFAHMLQHLLLAFAAPLLVVIGAPWLALGRGLPRRVRTAVARTLQAARRSPAWRRVAGSLTEPLLAVVLFNTTMLLWHLPGPFDLAVRNQAVHVWLEHASFFLFGLLLWGQLVDSPPFHPRWPPLLREAAALGTNAVMVGVAMTLVLFSHPLYAAYAAGPHTLLDRAADQQVAGSVLWVCGEFTLAPVIYYNIALWLRGAPARRARRDGAQPVVAPWVRAARRWRNPSPQAIELGWRVRE